MSEHQKSYCDSFVYIPQYGIGTASLNVNVATCLVLHFVTHLRISKRGKSSPALFDSKSERVNAEVDAVA